MSDKIERQYIGVCALLSKLYEPIKLNVPDNSEYLWCINRALDDFEGVLGNRFEVLRKIKDTSPYKLEPKSVPEQLLSADGGKTPV